MSRDGDKEPGHVPEDETARYLAPRLKTSLGFLWAALGGCGCHAEAKRLKVAAAASDEALSTALDDLQQRRDLDEEAAHLVGMFKALALAAGDEDIEEFRERCYRALGVR